MTWPANLRDPHVARVAATSSPAPKGLLANLPLTALFGPTALGKTAVATALARQLGGEVVTADSMQVYRGLPLLTNHPTSEQVAQVPHRLVGIVDPWQDFSVGQYAPLAHAAIDELRAQGRAVVLEGGSGLYVRAALGGLRFGPAPNERLRRELQQRLEAEGHEALVAELHALDPVAAGRVDIANRRRLLRALEVAHSSSFPRQADALWRLEGRYPFVLVVLEAEREWLRRRADERVDEMIAAGAIEELHAARASGRLSHTLQQAIGVRELGAYLDGALSLEEAAALMKARTRRLIRRQATWMRKVPAAARIPATGRPPADIAGDVATLLLRMITGGHS